MFGIGFPELVVIFLVVIIFIRPDDLPAFFRKLGALYGKAKRAYDEVAEMKDDFVRAVNEAASLEDKSGPADGRAAEAGQGAGAAKGADPAILPAAEPGSPPPSATPAGRAGGSGAPD
jgi:Sec-independent protein translocase protein TatA